MKTASPNKMFELYCTLQDFGFNCSYEVNMVTFHDDEKKINERNLIMSQFRHMNFKRVVNTRFIEVTLKNK